MVVERDDLAASSGGKKGGAVGVQPAAPFAEKERDMNNDARPTVEQLAKETGVLKECGTCDDYIASGDESARKRLYGRLSNLLRDEEPAFIGMNSEELMELMDTVIQDSFPCSCLDVE